MSICTLCKGSKNSLTNSNKRAIISELEADHSEQFDTGESGEGEFRVRSHDNYPTYFVTALSLYNIDIPRWSR